MKNGKIRSLAFIAAVTISTGIFAQKDAKKQAEKQNETKFEDTKLQKDVDFMVNAADDGMFEVQMAALAEKKSTDPKVKEFAAQMKKDHSKANEELKSLAAKKNVTLPTKISNKKQDKFDKMNKLEGKDFDDEYSEAMVSDHKDAIDMFQKEADNGKDGEMKAWAAGKIATLKHHLQMAQDTEKAVDNNKNK
ncbi:MAG: DUF4142 domain-containing protein [Bacteroidia bacterium]